MFAQFRDIAARSADTLLADAVGCAAVAVIILVGLHLPVFV